MNKSNDRTSPFEKQLAQSAMRLRDEQNYQLPLRQSPRRHNSVTTWAASIAAACIGWIVGISFPIGEEQPKNELALSVKPDTVVQYKERVVRDTIIQKVEVPVRVAAVPKQKEPKNLYADGNGCNVECDGIDYAMLIGM